MDISIFYWMALDTALFSDAEGGEDQVQDVVGGGLAGQRVERRQCTVKIKQDHLVRNGAGVGLRRIAQRRQRSRNRLVMAQAGQQAWFGRSSAGGEGQNPLAQFRNAFAGERGGF